MYEILYFSMKICWNLFREQEVNIIRHLEEKLSGLLVTYEYKRLFASWYYYILRKRVQRFDIVFPLLLKSEMVRANKATSKKSMTNDKYPIFICRYILTALWHMIRAISFSFSLFSFLKLQKNLLEYIKTNINNLLTQPFLSINKK